MISQNCSFFLICLLLCVVSNQDHYWASFHIPAWDCDRNSVFWLLVHVWYWPLPTARSWWWTPWDVIVAGHCHGYVAVEGVWMCISTATDHIAWWIFFSFSHLQNCNYSQITLFSFTFFWLSLLFGKEFLSSTMMKETQHECQGWCQRYRENRPETFILH